MCFSSQSPGVTCCNGLRQNYSDNSGFKESPQLCSIRAYEASRKIYQRLGSAVHKLRRICAKRIDVRIKPSNDALKANIEGYIGGVGDRDEEALLRFSRGAEEQARKAAQALGFYQPQISSDVKGGKTRA